MNARIEDSALLAESAPVPAARRRIGEVILDVQNISLSFGGVKALTDISFNVREHEVRSIIGPNGAGKSSMLNCINGVYTPQQGSITFRGKTFKHMNSRQVAEMGVARTFQNLALFKGMSVLDNIMSGRNLKMKSGILAQALLDEPMAGMNVEEKQDMSRFILDVNDEFGTTIVLIEHDMGVVMDISDRVVVLDYGKKIGDGTPDEVRNNEDVVRAYLGVEH